MRYATQLEKGDPNLVEVATKTKAEINEFVSYYRSVRAQTEKSEML